jgi:hypothetical protein
VVDALLPPVDVAMHQAPLLDLSKVTQLEDLSFRCEGPNVRWIVMALQTVQSKNLQRITVHPPTVCSIGEAARQEWRDLDRLLVRFWTSRPIHLAFAARKGYPSGGLGDRAPGLLPELMRRGAADLVEG